MSRADRFTKTQKQIVHYSDFATGFDKTPTTGLLAVVTNEQSVKQRIKNLVRTTMGTRPYHPLVGSKASALLFDLNTNITEDALKSTIKNTIDNDEPAARDVTVDVKFVPDSNIAQCYITFSIINIPDQRFDLTINLVRVH